MNQHNKSRLPRKVIVDKKYITLETELAKKLNELFTEIGSSLARKFSTPSKLFQSFLKKVRTTLHERHVTINELQDAFFLPKDEQETGANEISFNVIKNLF